MAFKPKDYVGKRFGRLVVIRRTDKRYSDGQYYREVQCDCGNRKLVLISNLTSGHTTSCGCFATELITKHGMGRTRTYRIWAGILERCNNPNKKAYPLYGGRGISVCDEWYDFRNFYADMGECPDGLTIDRIDNDGNYEPSNCRWATYSQQANNRRSTVILEYNGKKMSLKEWSIELGISYKAIVHRYQRGWSVEKTLTTPVKQSKA